MKPVGRMRRDECVGTWPIKIDEWVELCIRLIRSPAQAPREQKLMITTAFLTVGESYVERHNIKCRQFQSAFTNFKLIPLHN